MNCLYKDAKLSVFCFRETPLNEQTAKCRDFSQVRYLHFSHGGKPWTSVRDADWYAERYPWVIADLFVSWHNMAQEVCPSKNLGL